MIGYQNKESTCVACALIIGIIPQFPVPSISTYVLDQRIYPIIPLTHFYQLPRPCHVIPPHQCYAKPVIHFYNSNNTLLPEPPPTPQAPSATSPRTPASSSSPQKSAASPALPHSSSNDPVSSLGVSARRISDRGFRLRSPRPRSRRRSS